jgi:hypothetical protein
MHMAVQGQALRDISVCRHRELTRIRSRPRRLRGAIQGVGPRPL